MTILIENIPMPSRLLLTWQPVDGGSRYVIGELLQDESEGYEFNYLTDSKDFAKARDNGFRGFPAFDIKVATHRKDVMQTFSRRLPSRKREDFDDYLLTFRLPADFRENDFVLLACTGGKVASDGFYFVPDLSSVRPPFDYVMEVVGTRHMIKEGRLALDEISIGDEVILRNEDTNTVDPLAILVTKNDNHLGYVNKALCAALRDLSKNHDVSGVVVRKNGSSDRPLIYAKVSVR
nr:MAG TPA_asm: Helicase-like transcription factor/DNA repair, DNA BINDING PROTEIN-DNA.38A [Caudoviricetes sp.]